MGIPALINISLILLVFLIFILGGAYLILVYNNRKKEEGQKIKISGSSGIEASMPNITKEDMIHFLEFDDIKDNMIVRKKREQFVMVIACQGVNYDLMSEAEKIGVEEGFVQFLNTLRFPIQLYIQTRSVNLRDIIEDYKDRVKNVELEMDQIKIKVNEAKRKGDFDSAAKLEDKMRRKNNIYEYGKDITEYIGRLSLNKNVLQQKVYVVVSYFGNEFNGGSAYSKEELENIYFSELYTRCQTIIRSLGSSGVAGRILNSEELAEILYIAYNRDDSELMQLSKALDSEYDALYSTAKDVLIKKQEHIEQEIDEEAIQLATESIMAADTKRYMKDEEEKQKEVKRRAVKLVDEYKDQMDKDLYEETKKEIMGEETQNPSETKKG